LSADNAKKIVIVTGDVAMDWNLARAARCKRDTSFWGTTSTYWQRGGSALLADLIEAIIKELLSNESTQFKLYQTNAPYESRSVHTDDAHYHHSYAIWSPHKYVETDQPDHRKTAWRVEEFLGLDRARSEEVQAWQKVVDDPPAANLVILDDANKGFRKQKELWPKALNTKGRRRPWVLLKMANPLAKGPLWEKLHQSCADRLIVVATVSDLRLSEVEISRELSWERTAQDVFWELVYNPCVNSLSDCAHVVISFGAAGAIHLSRQNADFQCSLFFDPLVMEGMWEQKHPGGMIGYASCLTAGLARELMRNLRKPNLSAGIQAGLAAIRTLHLEGYGERGVKPAEAKLAFPKKKVVATLAQANTPFTVAQVPDPKRFVDRNGEEQGFVDDYWTILHDRYIRTLYKTATQVVREGPETALVGVPWGQFGKLLTVDRQEIESFRSIRNLVFEYCNQPPQRRSLSIAVFGPPGSGKSFGIVEIAKSLRPGQIKVLEFNLSQFDSADDLLSAFHQVRDVGLTGEIPLVFWDEFDTPLEGVQLGWLRYFLAPMQDGAFQEGQITHPIGRSIFVFAGGTCANIKAFGQELTPEEFRAVKGPDFVSRLKGYINVLGPNRIKRDPAHVATDPYFIIRRAILLRSSLKRSAPQLFTKRDKKELLNIDRGVLRAFLRTSDYKHGARSIDAIIAMSQLAGKTVFERSNLPAESQLDLHCDGKLFMCLVRQVELPETPENVLEELAELAHNIFCKGLRSRGYKYGATTNEQLKTHAALLPYAKLSDALKEQNRLYVSDIPVKLAAAGYVMVPTSGNIPSIRFPDTVIEQLAEAEHSRWMRSLLDDGWRYAPQTDHAKKLHKCLVPWDNEPPEEKEKDRDLVRGIPGILAKAGYTIVKC